MKKIFTLMMVALTVMVARATDYDEPIVVSVNGVATTQHGLISVNKQGDKYELTLKNFALNNGGSVVGVGNVTLTDIEAQTAGSTVLFDVNRDITMTAGDNPNVPLWIGPTLGPIPVSLLAAIDGDRLNAMLQIDMQSSLGQLIKVNIGSGLQFPNPTFEEWHTSSGSYEEPNGWHSFESASGALAALAGHHIEKSENGRNSSLCARIFATSIFGIVANGTMTTGRMNAGSISATDTSNNAYLDMSKTDKDGNGDPFYVTLTARPDSLALWLQFKQGTVNANHPYATVSAAITDGTYYQDPEDKEYTNVVAKASNHEIAQTGGEWKRISVPFNYISDTVEPKAILLTVSTNADAGQGSANDEVLVDDIELIYNASLASLNVPGFAPDVFAYELESDMTLDAIEAKADSRDAYVVKTLGESEDGFIQAEVKVYAADLSKVARYTIKFKNSPVGIKTVATSPASAVYYNLSGQQVQSAKAGQVFIERRADGRVVKVRK